VSRHVTATELRRAREHLALELAAAISDLVEVARREIADPAVPAKERLAWASWLRKVGVAVGLPKPLAAGLPRPGISTTTTSAGTLNTTTTSAPASTPRALIVRTGLVP
jgi:hypothetical protein